MKVYGGVDDLDTGWRWVASFTPWLLYSLGNSPLYPLDRRLVGIWKWSGRCEEKKNLLPPTRNAYERGNKNGESFDSDGNISE
jgi:hypothetical protein